MGPPNPFLTGNFAPVRDELNVVDLEVEGALPPELNGLLLRNGPNPIKPDPTHHSWFLGDGMVHGIELRAGRAVSYRNRWIRTDQASALLDEEPPDGHPGPIAPSHLSVANTNIIGHGGRVLALLELCLPTELDTALGTAGRFDFGGQLRSAMTAHPKTDPQTGELFFFGYDPLGPPYLRFHVADADGQLTYSQEVPVAGPAMMHDFALTRSYAVFLDLPVVFDPERLQRGKLPFRWTPEYGSRVGLLPRRGGDVRWFDVRPCYVFHTINAHDDGDMVVVDVVRHPSMLGGPGGSPTLDRWRIAPATGTVTEERLDDHSQEFPRVDDRLIGHPYRYAHATQTPKRPGVYTFGGLLKHDLRTGRVETARLRPDDAAGEPVFAPAGTGEEDGWLLSVVYDAARDGSDLVVLSARDFTAPPVARVRLPQRVPFGFHGNWLSDQGSAT